MGKLIREAGTCELPHPGWDGDGRETLRTTRRAARPHLRAMLLPLLLRHLCSHCQPHSHPHNGHPLRASSFLPPHHLLPGGERLQRGVKGALLNHRLPNRLLRQQPIANTRAAGKVVVVMLVQWQSRERSAA